MIPLLPDGRLAAAVLCSPAPIQAAPSVHVQGKSMTLSARRGGRGV